MGMISLSTLGTKGVLSILTQFFEWADLFAIFFDVSCMRNNDKISRINSRYKSGFNNIRYNVAVYFKHTSFLAIPCNVRNYSTNPAIVVMEKKYKNADTDKLQILEENKNKSGIYRWINQVNNKSYIGSSANLTKRFKGYYSINNLEYSIQRAKSNIYSAILKYGYSNFSLEIIEYVSSTEVITREQYYIDLLKPEYNILPTAGSRKGYKSSPETIDKLKILSETSEHIERLKIHNSSAEQKERLRIHNSSQEHLERLLKNSLLKARKVEVLDILSNETNVFNSISEAGRFIGCSETAVRKALKGLKEKEISILIKKRYLVKPTQDNE